MKDLFYEVTPLAPGDCFWVGTRRKSAFDFPLHYHDDFELNFIRNGAGVRRIIGDHVGEADDLELVMVGPSVPHTWTNGRMRHAQVEEVTIQFHQDLFTDRFLNRNELSGLKNLMETASRGVLFSEPAARQIMRQLKGLSNRQGFGSMLTLLAILNDLSTDTGRRLLSDTVFNDHWTITYHSDRIKDTMHFLDMHYGRNVSLSEAAAMNHMTGCAFSRFFKNHTGMTFLEALIEKRVGHVSRMLIETNLSVAEIADSCGFNNMSNFNRIFKKKKRFTPKEYRKAYQDSREIPVAKRCESIMGR